MRRFWRLSVQTGTIMLFPPDSDFGDADKGSSFAFAWDRIVRATFAAYYVPALLVAVSALLDTMLHIAFAALIPSVQELAPEMQHPSVTSALRHWLIMWHIVLPYTTAMVGVLAVAHNVLKVTGESMVDSYSVFNGVDYALTLALFTSALESKSRAIVLCIVSAAFCAVFVIVFLTDALLMWSSRDLAVQYATWSIIVSQFAATTVSVVKLAMTEDPLADYPEPGKQGPTPKTTMLWFRAFVIVWWKANIGRIRHAAVNILGVFVLFWTVTEGPIVALERAVETLCYLNLPNMLGFTCLASAFSFTRGLHCLRWLARHPNYRTSFLILIAPYTACWLYTLMYFTASRGVCLLAGFALNGLFVHAIELCRQHEVGPLGAVQWTYAGTKRKDGVLSPSSRGIRVALPLASELEDALQRKNQFPALVSLEFKSDLQNMTLENRIDGCVRKLERTVTRGLTTARPPKLRYLLVNMMPRLLLLQSRHSFTGTRFNRTRIVLKVVTAILISILFAIVGGAIAQETVAFLRPVKMLAEKVSHRAQHEASTHGFEEIVVRHLVVDLHIEFDPLQRLDTDVVLRPEPLSEKSNNGDGDGDGLGTLCIREHKGVTLFEMGVLTVAAYLHDREAVFTFVNGTNDAFGSDWELVFPGVNDTGPSRLPRGGWKSLVEVHSATRNVSLIIVRGTDFTSFFDVLQDISIYVESFLYQLMTHIVPASHLVPARLVSDTIELAAAIEAYIVPWIDRRVTHDNVFERHFHDIVARYVVERFPTPEARRHVVLTGHSLGGAVAHIAAARIDAKSFGFQSPGIVLPRKKLGLTTAQLHKATTTVMSTDDIVPLIGWQAGEVLQFDCAEQYRERCHAVEATVAEMWRACASLRRRFLRIKRVWVE
jgi:lipase ATG15